MPTFSEQKKTILARERPSKADLKQMTNRAKATLSFLKDFEHVAFPNRDEFFDLFETLTREKYADDIQVSEQEPPKAEAGAIVLSNSIVGCAPGQYHVWIYWFHGNVYGCFVHIQIVNPRN